MLGVTRIANCESLRRSLRRRSLFGAEFAMCLHLLSYFKDTCVGTDAGLRGIKGSVLITCVCEAEHVGGGSWKHWEGGRSSN